MRKCICSRFPKIESLPDDILQMIGREYFHNLRRIREKWQFKYAIEYGDGRRLCILNNGVFELKDTRGSPCWVWIKVEPKRLVYDVLKQTSLSPHLVEFDTLNQVLWYCNRPWGLPEIRHLQERMFSMQRRSCWPSRRIAARPSSC